MDISKEYIKMCEKAVETQEYYINSSGMLIPSFKHDIIDDDGSHTVWLPRQDQLQDILIDYWNKQNVPSCPVQFLKEMHEFVYMTEMERGIENMYSLEELTLAFVMKEKYNKKWNGNDWEL